MKKIEDLFKDGDGMKLSKSTPEQRKEIWELLFSKKLIYSQEFDIKKELSYVENRSFIYDRLVKSFVPCFNGDADKNIPFEEFKNRLVQL